jgi:hypothetical protein
VHNDSISPQIPHLIHKLIRSRGNTRMPWLRHHFYCEGCDGTWLVEAEATITADCPFCSARDLFPYRSDDRAALTTPHLLVLQAATVTKPSRETRPSKQPQLRSRAAAKAAS